MTSLATRPNQLRLEHAETSSHQLREVSAQSMTPPERDPNVDFGSQPSPRNAFGVVQPSPQRRQPVTSSMSPFQPIQAAVDRSSAVGMTSLVNGPMAATHPMSYQETVVVGQTLTEHLELMTRQTTKVRPTESVIIANQITDDVNGTQLMESPGYISDVQSTRLLSMVPPESVINNNNNVFNKKTASSSSAVDYWENGAADIRRPHAVVALSHDAQTPFHSGSTVEAISPDTGSTVYTRTSSQTSVSPVDESSSVTPLQQPNDVALNVASSVSRSAATASGASVGAVESGAEAGSGDVAPSRPSLGGAAFTVSVGDRDENLDLSCGISSFVPPSLIQRRKTPSTTRPSSKQKQPMANEKTSKTATKTSRTSNGDIKSNAAVDCVTSVDAKTSSTLRNSVVRKPMTNGPGSRRKSRTSMDGVVSAATEVETAPAALSQVDDESGDNVCDDNVSETGTYTIDSGDDDDVKAARQNIDVVFGMATSGQYLANAYALVRGR